jgi:hypothetical protein
MRGIGKFLSFKVFSVLAWELLTVRSGQSTALARSCTAQQG